MQTGGLFDWIFISTCPPALFNSSFKVVCVCLCFYFFLVVPEKRPRRSEALWSDELKTFSVISQSSFARLLSSPSAASCKRRSSSIQRAIYQDETNESLRELTVRPGKANSALLWNVWEFLILWREEERVILGLVWLFINLPFPLFLGGVVISLPPPPSLSPTRRETAIQRLRTKLFHSTSV